MKQIKPDEQWLDEIRQSLADHKEELPAGGWEKIAATMASAEQVRPEVMTERPMQPAAEAKQLRIVPRWLHRAAAVALLGGIVAGSMYYFSETQSPSNPAQTSVKQQTATIPPEVTKLSDSASAPLEGTTPLPESNKHVSTQQHSGIKPLEETQNELSALTTARPTAKPAQELASEPATEPNTPTDSLPDIHAEEQTILLAMEAGSDCRKSIDYPWNIGVRLGRNGSKDYDFGESYYGINEWPMLSNPTPHDSIIQRCMTPALTRATMTEPIDEVQDSDNHLSWSAGISVSKQLSKHFSLESGLVYTYLSSDVTMSRSGRQHQQLHYLGIPLKVNATIAEQGAWLFYADLGAMLEHSLHGRRGNTDLHLNDWQWSISGGLGLQYKLSNYIGLYVEPGVNYYFNNGTDVPSLRTESPFVFNLQIGVRFGL